MDKFLNLVATHLYQQTQGDLAHTAVVFPNKRASLFFNEYLAQQSNSPLWAPTYLSISDLFKEMADCEVADSIKLVCELYKTFTAHTHSKETLDEFYFWGELLISDYDDADKNMVNTQVLFQNLKDLHDIMNTLSFLTPEQEAAIQEFFTNFSLDKSSELKDRFISLWNVLGDIYTSFKASLREQKIAYEGMLYRDVVENLQAEKLKYDRYVFVGFNVLNQVETQLFSFIKNQGKAVFYWDYDTAYTTRKENHEAGTFIIKNMEMFPSPLSEDLFNNLSTPKRIEYVASPTENAQTRYIHNWLSENMTERESDSAVVLCNENLIQPVLHALPDNVKHINLTMGFPLSQTPICSFLCNWLNLQIEGYRAKEKNYEFAYVMPMLTHPYTRRITTVVQGIADELKNDNRFYPSPQALMKDEFTTLLFEKMPADNMTLCNRMKLLTEKLTLLYRDADNGMNDDMYGQLYKESLFKAYTTLNRLSALIESGDLILSGVAFRNLFKKIMYAAKIPFHGEPAIGLQVMGVLETRNLDFKHLLMLSVNEGYLPKAEGNASFIPYNLRKAFGMTTIEKKVAVYAYYFYRLIQRAERVTFTYNNNTEGLKKGEKSRFMLQYQIESGQDIKQYNLDATLGRTTLTEMFVEKTPEVINKLLRRYDLNKNPKAMLSPSALNTYLDCQLKFYFKYIANIPEPKEVNADIESNTFGSIFHRSVELIYQNLSNNSQKVINKENIEEWINNEALIKNTVNDAFKELFFHVDSDVLPEYNGLQLINLMVITRYIKQLLRYDANYAPFTMLGMEEKVKYTLNVPTPQGEVNIGIGGTIDRLDLKDGTVRVLDYKTGGKAVEPNDISDLFTPQDKRANYVLQVMLYSLIARKKFPGYKLMPAIFYVNRAASSLYDPSVRMGEIRKKQPITDVSPYEAEFHEKLTETIAEMFNPDINLEATENKEKCTYCIYRSLCGNK